MDSIDEMILIGKKLESLGLIESSHSGNISVRNGNKFLIKKHGKMMGSLNRDDIIELDFNDEKGYEIASSEVYAHRSIYLNTDAKAIIHAHTPYAITLSMFFEKIFPVDAEGKYYLEYIPVIISEDPVASKDIAEKLGSTLKDHYVAIVRGHGTFSRGKDLNEALKYLTICESVSHLKYLYDLWNSNVHIC
ncbi:MAG: class II aldolase/adducin family protein [Thermoplasmata archaeon]|nr:class II aldolase/adducin family protein [Thermoplasmata archaeon]